jgi:Secretion system C-terminal sorting domain
MKKFLPFLFVLTCSTAAFSQVCMRDSSLIQSGALLSPAFWEPITMQYNLNDACITHPYNQSVTINVPTTYSGFQLLNVTVPTTGAISDLPIGLTYSCDPPNCVFLASTLGCIRLFGTPTSANMAPDTFDLGISTIVNTLIGGIPLVFPGQLPGGNHYYLALKDAQCLVGTYDQHPSIGYVVNAPNPFSSETNITVESIVSGDFQFEVFDLLGQRVHARVIRLDAGMNEFSFDGNHLPSGSYFYTIGNRDGKVSRRLVIGR